MQKRILQAFWVLVIVLSAYYLYRALRFRFFAENNLNGKALWYYGHLLTALFPLVLGPLQFWKWLRLHHVWWHRFLGKLYIIGSILGGLSAFYLGITIDLEGSIVSLILLSLTWLFMTIAAYVTIRNKNVEAHRLFMIRSYALAMVFVFLRLVGDIPQEKLFFFIESEAIRDATLEWVSWIIPLLVIELVFSWIPLMKTKRKPRRAA